MERGRLAVLVLAAVVLVLVAGGVQLTRAPRTGQVVARPAPRSCAAVAELVSLQARSKAPDGPFLFHWRDALTELARSGEPVVRARQRGAVRVVDAFVRHGARDVEERSDRWEKDVRLTGALIATLVRNTAAVRADEPLLPAPTGWGCRSVGRLRTVSALAGFDPGSWDRRAHLPGIGDAVTERALHDLPLLHDDQRFTASCGQWYRRAMGAPLGDRWDGTITVNTRSSLFGTTYVCGYGDGRRRLAVARVSDLQRVVDLVGTRQRTPVGTPLGDGYRVEDLRLAGGPPSTAWVLLDPEESGALVLLAAPGLGDLVLQQVAGALARTTYR